MNEKTNFESTGTLMDNSSEATFMAEVVAVELPDGNRTTAHEHETDAKPKGQKAPWYKRIRQNLASTYAKRHPIVNALLTMYMLMALFLSFSLFMSGFTALFSIFEHRSIVVLLAAFLMWFLAWYYFYYMYQFVVCNRKDAFVFAHLGSIVNWFFLSYAIYVLLTPIYTYNDEGNRVEDTFADMALIAFLYSLLINAVIVAVVYLIMKIRKYGASAWTLLDVSRKRFRSRFDKVCFNIFCISVIIIAVFCCVADSLHSLK